MSINDLRDYRNMQPSPYPTEDFVRFPRRQEGMSDIEAQLKRQLADLHREYQQRAEPIIRQLCVIESMRPPRLMIIDESMIEPAMFAHLWRNAGEKN